MSVLDRLERLARHRLPPDERRALDSFVADIERHRRPGTPEERRLDRRARLVHLATATTSGGVTLAGVGLSGLVTAVGAVLLLLAPVPPTPSYDEPVPVWIETSLILGVIAVAIECARFPHRIRRVGFAVACLPLAVGGLGVAATMPVALPPDVGLRIALGFAGAGAVVSAVAAAGGRPRAARRGMVLLGVAGLGICLCDGIWTAIYAADEAGWHAAGCAFSAIGGLLMANGLLFAHPTVGRSG